MSQNYYIAEYKGQQVIVFASDPNNAKTLAAIEMGIPESRERYVRLHKKISHNWGL